MEKDMDYWVQKTAKMLPIIGLFLSSLSCQKEEKFKLPYYNTPDFTPIFVANSSEIEKVIPHTVGDFSLRNQDSLMVSQKIIANKVHIANFIFTSCGSICPTMTENMKLINEAFKKDSSIVLLSYSVTPWIDTPKVLEAYKNKNNIENLNWQFLTGSKSDIYTLARKSYFAEEDMGYDKDSTEFLHTEHFILVDDTKRIRGIYNGTLRLEMEQLINDIKTLQTEH